jgi:hypothetical protein
MTARLRFFIPALARRIVFEITLGPAEARNEIIRFTETIRPVSAYFRQIGKRDYYGEVRQSSFRMQPYLIYRHAGYGLVVRGQIEPTDSGSRVTVTLRALQWLVWVVIVMGIEIRMLCDPSTAKYWLLPPVVFSVFHTFCCALYYLQVRYACEDLTAALGMSTIVREGADAGPEI